MAYRWFLIEIFVIANLAFLALDVYLAHSINRFRSPAEWIPICFSVTAPIFLVAVNLTAGVAEPLLGLSDRALWEVPISLDQREVVRFEGGPCDVAIAEAYPASWRGFHEEDTHL